MSFLRRLFPAPPPLDPGPADEVRLYTANWCPYCRRVTPAFRKLRRNNSGRLKLVDISSNHDPRWDSDRIKVVPTLLALREGREVARQRGPFDDRKMVQFIARHLENQASG